jgi:cytochrome c5
MIHTRLSYGKEVLVAKKVYSFGFMPESGRMIFAKDFQVLGLVWCEMCGNVKDTERMTLWFGNRYLCKGCRAKVSTAANLQRKSGAPNWQAVPAFCHCGKPATRKLAAKSPQNGHVLYFKDEVCDACLAKYSEARYQFSRTQLWMVRR